MRSGYLPDDLKRLWQELAASPRQVSAEDLRREAAKLRRLVLVRNCFVTAVCCFVVGAYGFFFLRATTVLERIGSAASIVGIPLAVMQFLKRPARSIPVADALESTRFYRAELERQRDFHRVTGVFSWLLPVLPGPILFNLGFALDRPKFAPLVELQMAGFLIISVIVVVLNLRMARRFQGRLDALDAWRP
jgi:hypothetical protein